MLKSAARRPNQNAESIQGIGSSPGFALKAFGLDDVAQRSTIAPLGFSVETTMITVNARVLNSPALQYKRPGGKQALEEIPRFGAWNLAKKAFQKPGSFKKFGVLILGWNGSALRVDSGPLITKFE